MGKYLIHGQTPLIGEVQISGSKNAAVAIIPAALLVEGKCRIENIPDIGDVKVLTDVLIHMGAKVSYIDRNTIEIDSSQINYIKLHMKWLKS